MFFLVIFFLWDFLFLYVSFYSANLPNGIFSAIIVWPRTMLNPVSNVMMAHSITMFALILYVCVWVCFYFAARWLKMCCKYLVFGELAVCSLPSMYNIYSKQLFSFAVTVAVAVVVVCMFCCYYHRCCCFLAVLMLSLLFLLFASLFLLAYNLCYECRACVLLQPFINTIAYFFCLAMVCFLCTSKNS